MISKLIFILNTMYVSSHTSEITDDKQSILKENITYSVAHLEKDNKNTPIEDISYYNFLQKYLDITRNVFMVNFILWIALLITMLFFRTFIFTLILTAAVTIIMIINVIMMKKPILLLSLLPIACGLLLCITTTNGELILKVILNICFCSTLLFLLYSYNFTRKKLRDFKTEDEKLESQLQSSSISDYIT